LGQKRTKQERLAPRNLFIQHDVIPDDFRAGVEVKPRRNRFADPFAGEQTT
jgi:hypothetical protein